MGWPVAASQSRAVLSELPVSTVLPSGLNATAMTGPDAKGAEGPARRRVPEPRRLVLAPGEHGLAVGAERHRNDRALMRQGWPEGLARRRVPEPRRIVTAPGDHGLAVGAERHG